MLYVLDLDDTLILEKDFVYSGFKAVDKWLASNSIVKEFFEISLKIFEEGARGNVFNLALERAGYIPSSNLIQTLVYIYRSHKPQIYLLLSPTVWQARRRLRQTAPKWVRIGTLSFI
jgi:putative hydrolase of the HAD superfamily